VTCPQERFAKIWFTGFACVSLAFGFEKTVDLATSFFWATLLKLLAFQNFFLRPEAGFGFFQVLMVYLKE